MIRTRLLPIYSMVFLWLFAFAPIQGNAEVLEVIPADHTNTLPGEPSLLKVTATITGRVTNNAGEALVGATVRAKGSNQGALTDESGSYSITVNDEVTALLVSYIGYETKEVAIDGRTTINISLDEGASSLDEVVVLSLIHI